jgi:sensor histidine kinase YesM
MLDHLIQYLRSALPEIRTGSSTLGREVQLARSYLAIMGMRVGPGLHVSIDVPPEVESEPFPPLMLLTLVENAVKHGVAPRGGGHVAIGARVADGVLCVTVADDGPGLGGPIGQGVGLANTRERLRALHGEEGRLELASAAGGGTIATVRVPAS